MDFIKQMVKFYNIKTVGIFEKTYYNCTTIDNRNKGEIIDKIRR